MKKSLSFCLAVIMILTFLPINASASETPTSDHDRLVSLACEIFPEYAHNIRNSNTTTFSADGITEDRYIVFSETRNVSENEYMMYTEYSDGLALLTDYSFDYKILTYNPTTGAGATEVTMSLEATCEESGYNGVFYIDNFRYVLDSYGYDSIISLGTTRTTGSCKLSSVNYPNPDYYLYETASDDAYVNYALDYWPGDSGYFTLNSYLEIKVGNNGCTITHLDRG